MLERFQRGDRRFLALCAAAAALCAAIGFHLFPVAFPEASLELKVTRGQARDIARQFLREEAAAPVAALSGSAGWHEAARFSVDGTPKVYLERTLGLSRANELFGRQAKVWSWDFRWFRSGQKEEWRASVTPRGSLLGFEHVVDETAPGARLPSGAARERALSFLAARGFSPASLDLVESVSQSRPRRTDWTLTFQRHGFAMGEATVRYRVLVLGDAVGGYREFVKVPESWRRAYGRLRSANDTTSRVDTLFLLLTMLIMLVVLVQKTTRRDVPWRLVGAFAGVAFVLTLLSLLNGFSVSGFDYDTASPYSAFLLERLLLAGLAAAGQAVLIGLVVAAGEPVFRERFAGRLSISGVFSRRGLRTRSTFHGLVLGYAMTAFFFAYQAVFYVVAGKFGAWAPADVPYDNILNTALPWATVLFMGFFPAVSEEFMSRIFSISFLDRFTRSRAVVLVVPALIWGFGHSAYPNQPFYIRGVEVGLAGILIGVVFLRYGVVPILVWHFTVDAIYTALLMFRSGNLYYIVSGGLAAGILLVPLAVAAVAYLRTGGFQPEAGLTNGDAGFVPPAAPAPSAKEPAAAARPLSPALAKTALAVVVALCAVFLLRARPPGSAFVDRIGKARAAETARAFLRANGALPERFRMAAYTATGYAADSEMEGASPGESGLFAGMSDDAAQYVLEHGGAAAFDRVARRYLPPELWAVRFFRPQEKEEWKILVDAGSGRVAAFAHPIEEAAPASGTPTLPEAEARARLAASRLGYPAADYAVVDAAVQTRPHRVDTRVVLEVEKAGIGQARPRLAFVFHGARLAAAYPSLKVPDDYRRQRERRGAPYWILFAVKITAAALLLGVALWVFLAVVRNRSFEWKTLALPAGIVVVLAAAGAANAWPGLWRSYRTEIPAAAFELSVGIALLIRVLLAGIGAFLAFGFVSAARPDWRRALRAPGRGRDAFLRAAMAALGLAAIHRGKLVLATLFPAVFGADVGMPRSLESLVPGFAAVWSGAGTLLLFVAATAIAALAASSDRFSSRRSRWTAAAVLALLAIPLSAESVLQAALPAVATLATLAWAVFAFAFLLGDSVRAWVLFGFFALVGSGAADLLAQPARPDALQGLLAIALGGMLTLALLARKTTS
jgi:hypothetical protein